MDKERSFFRQNLLQMISNKTELDGNCLVLASGYFWEEISPKTSEKYSVTIDRLLKAIQGNDGIEEVQVIGAMRSLVHFHNFCNNLEDEWDGRVTRRGIKSNNWYAKVAMKLQSGNTDHEKTPICAIIGSSNLVCPAYGIEDDIPENVTVPFRRFNHECDVLIFSNEGFTNQDASKKIASVSRIRSSGYWLDLFLRITERLS